MSQSRVVFVIIIVVTLVIVCAALAFQAVSNLISDNSTTANGSSDNGETVDQPTDVPAGTVLVTMTSSNTKEDWLDAVVAKFNAEGHQTAAGNLIVVEAIHGTSGGTMNDIISGKTQPIAWSPGDQSWVEQINESWQQTNNKPIINQACQATVFAPLGFAMWRPMAETLGWPNTPIGWDKIVELAADPDGWSSYGRPEWGVFRFGHTHPAYANSGLLAMTSFVYGVLDKTDGVTASDVYSQAVEDAMRELEGNTSKYGRQAPDLLDLMARQGPSYLHAAAVPESEVVKFNIQRGDELTFPLAFIFPSGGTIWADQPYCILDNADWVDDDEAEAAQIFLDYMLDKPQQEMAIDNFLRPSDTSIPLRAPLTLENGTDPNVTPAIIPSLPSPNAEISSAVIDLFNITKRKATTLIVIDVSGSMEQDDRIGTARTATVEFLNRLDANDEVGLIIFSNDVTTVTPPTRVGDVVESMSQRVSGLIADGNTALYQSVCEAVAAMEQLRQEDLAAGESRLYGIILLSDGEDTVGEVTENQMFATCLPDNAEADGIKIFPIAFGDDADTNVLARIATVTGGKLFTADPDSISNVYVSISAEQ